MLTFHLRPPPPLISLLPTKRLGTLEYMAPEIFRCKAYGPEVDCWAVGVLTYECLFNRVPWELDASHGVSYKDWATHILAARLKFDSSRHQRVISAEARDFISSCLDVDPRSRLTVQQMLLHPWIQKK